MKKYDGPVFNNGTSQSAKRRFEHPAQGMEAGKSKFEPAYSAKQKKLEQVEEVQLTQSKLKDEETTKDTDQSTPKSGLENYDIPFLKNQNKSLATSNDKVDSTELQEKIPKNQRIHYEPSFKQQSEEKNKQKQTFKPTELPKPYKKPEAINQRADENTRLLAKRLQKSKNSFLLFEN